MTLLDILRIGVVASLLLSMTALAVMLFRTRARGRHPLLAAPRGSETRGIVYAFSMGMMPWAKESASHHLPTFLGGLVYHFGVGAAGTWLLAVIMDLELPAMIINILAVVILAGAVCGLALLAKRGVSPLMRAISCPDDFLANGLVTIFLLLALDDILRGSIRPVFLGSAMVMFLYIPLGKIRHCAYFFYTRMIFGRFYGRRGVLPHPEREVTHGL